MSRQGAQIPRLKDVAEEAEVSIGTASRVLNGDSESFNPDTRARVTEAAERLGWRRNLLVDGMQKGRTKTVGVMIPPHDSFWIGVIAGIHMELAEKDFLPITIWIGDCREMPQFDGDHIDGIDQINRLLDRRVDGLILWPSFAAAYFDHYRELMQRRIPVVAIDHRFEQANIADAIETDEQQGTREVAEHLIGLGHRRIACLSAREVDWQSWSVRRREQFEQAVIQLGGEPVRSHKTNARGTNGLEVAIEVLSAEPRPTAVFAVSDHMARLLYKAADKLGLRIPEDVSVVGFADLDFAAELSPPLTTVRQESVEIGRRAASSVLRRLASADQEEARTEPVLVPPTFVQRDSTAAVNPDLS